MENQKIVCVLYDDPVTGYPPKYARDDVPKITNYPDGQTTPTPEGRDFNPGDLLVMPMPIKIMKMGIKRFHSF